MRKHYRRMPVTRSGRGKHFSPLMLVGLSVPVVLALVATTVFMLPRLGTHAAAAGDCTLTVPNDPLTAQGLATPYLLSGMGCTEANPATAAFVQAAIFDPATNSINIYNPLVVDQSGAAAQPAAVNVPVGSTVGIWFGFNGNNLTLKSANGNGNDTLMQGRCVNGTNGSIFGQFAYCNAPAFFITANQAIQAGLLTPPALGTALDRMPCPTSRDFSIVDQDQSDNLTTTYLVDMATGKTAQNNAAGMAAIPANTLQKNPSDERLLTLVDKALNCQPFMAPDLSNGGALTTALALNELQAAAFQQPPVALVPVGDPMVLTNNQPDLNKVNLYRAGVDQMQVNALGQASTTTYCADLNNIAPKRLQLDQQFTQGQPSPDPAVANSLFTFLAQRFVFTFGPNGLNCTGLLHVQSPVMVTMDGKGVVVAAQFNTGQNGDNGRVNKKHEG